MGGFARLDVVHKRVAGVLPAVEATAERAHAVDADFVELEGDFGGGLLTGAGAVEDDVAIAGDDLVVLLELGGTDADGAGEDAGIGQIVERVAEVDDEGRDVALGGCGVEHLLELGGIEPHGADLGEEAALLDDAIGHEAEHHKDEDADGEVAEEGEELRALLCEIAEEASGEQEGLGPEDGAGEIVEQEAGVRHAGLSGNGGGDGAEAGDELGEEQGDGTAAGEVALGFGDAGGGLEGEAAEQAEDAVAVAAAEGVPEAVGEDTGGEDGEERGGGADAMGGAEGAGGEEDGDAGDGEAELLHKHPEEEDQVGVLDEEGKRDRHGGYGL